jgi:hypothetical protein
MRMHMKISDSQFEIDGDRLIHTPTGALFWMGETDTVNCEWGIAGTQLGTGHDYDKEQLKEAARDIFRLQKARSISY